MKQKIVWICHFTNSEIQSKLPLRKRLNEYSSWVPNILKGFENYDNIEVHVICPHEYLRKDTHMKFRNINYYFLSFGIPGWHRHWPRFFRFDLWTDFHYFRRKIRRIVNHIRPALINLHGAENARYSSVALDLYQKYPVLVLIQGFISEYKNAKGLSLDIKKRIIVEEEILSKLKFFCGDIFAADVVARYNNNFKYFILDYPVNEDLINTICDVQIKYDCIFFGRLTLDKGVGEFIKVVAELKKFLPDIRACIVGGGDTKPFQLIAEKLECMHNIDFVGFLSTQKELFEYVKSSKIVLAPPLVERLSCTIRESMLLRVPIVAYATGAIPSVNEKEENIIIVDKGDHKAMALKTILLLQNEDFRIRLSEKAYNFYMKKFSLEVSTNLFMAAYKSIQKTIN